VRSMACTNASFAPPRSAVRPPPEAGPPRGRRAADRVLDRGGRTRATPPGGWRSRGPPRWRAEYTAGGDAAQDRHAERAADLRVVSFMAEPTPAFSGGSDPMIDSVPGPSPGPAHPMITSTRATRG
jgi:hypothetical protein